MGSLCPGVSVSLSTICLVVYMLCFLFDVLLAVHVLIGCNSFENCLIRLLCSEPDHWTLSVWRSNTVLCCVRVWRSDLLTTVLCCVRVLGSGGTVEKIKILFACRVIRKVSVNTHYTVFCCLVSGLISVSAGVAVASRACDAMQD